MDPDADTARATVPRSTRTVGPVAFWPPRQLTATTLMATTRTRAIAASRRNRRLRWIRGRGPVATS